MAESIELGTIPTNASQTDADPRPESSTRDQQDIDEEPAHATSLSPVDGGWRAWLFLVAATWIEVLVWGLPFSVGILHVYWTNTLFPGEGASTLTLAATLQTGLLFVNAGLFGPVIAAYPRWQKLAQAIGLLSASVGLISSAFATRPWHLLVSIGCIYPLCGALYVPCATLLFEWFLERRGLATGIMYAGTGLGGTIVPYIMDGLLKGVGYKAAMCSLGIAYAVLGGVALIFIDRRIPISRYANNSEEPRSSMRQRLNLSFVKRPSFFLGITTILLTSVSSFATTLWLPAFADDLSLTNPSGTVLISILNAASIPGTALLGYLSDHLPIGIVISISCIGSGLACAFLWGFGTSGGGILIGFAVLFGLLGPSFAALWTGMIVVIAKDDLLAPPMIFSIFAICRGVGSLISGPISGALLKTNAMEGAPGAYGFQSYGVLLIFITLSISAGAVTGFYDQVSKVIGKSLARPVLARYSLIW
ncbi:hypothetical protein, variant 2 [Cryptococcus amylolentus CBS 6039]|nr:hypothetical protein, variant 1 [Cryptococcus amylolentus CBS 6039]XP_018990613.1 hypothetical protein, variant 2 [Cryptococcus amylolentus CBS 6039]ODN74831.1 hypothetical protein, variant 1 [Cryptococcus amylolentus CBS 6039]ODN74832.1 hypothetical protein, variant 2 [Cryptococcus amylolentus CBS 6039]